MNNYLRTAIITFVLSITLGLINSVSAKGNVLWRAEAESASQFQNGARVKPEKTAGLGPQFVSGTQLAHLNDTNAQITFNDVSINKAGNYRFSFGTWNLAPSTVEIYLNGSIVATTSIPQYVGIGIARARIETLSMNLPAGNNTLSIRSSDNVHIDYVQIARNTPSTYFVSDSLGDDNNDGLSQNSPLKSLEAISQITLFPGDKIRFMRGDTFRGLFSIHGSGTPSNPITVQAYGIGDKPILSGSGVPGGDHGYVIHINNVDGIVINNIEITNERINSRAGYNDEMGYGIAVINNAHEVMEYFRFNNLTLQTIYSITADSEDFDKYELSGIYCRTEKNEEGNNPKNIADVTVTNSHFTRLGKFGFSSRHYGGEGSDELVRNKDFVIRNNTFFETGGSAIAPGNTYNCLVEYNIIDYPGSSADPRMVERGSGAWFFSCRNVIAQYNISRHARGWNDSYGIHIDFNNENVIVQYNYTEDSEGGFCEILGKNINSCYRYNISVNDGFRESKGNSIWIEDFAGTGNKVKSDLNYVYNNTIYVDANITPDISITSKNSYIYNNIFYAAGGSRIGESVEIKIEQGSELVIHNNLFYGNVDSKLTRRDSAGRFLDPKFTEPGMLSPDGYKLQTGSPVIDTSFSFPEPEFPMAGQGIFANIPLTPTQDYFGNSASVSTNNPHLGAFNGTPIFVTNLEIRTIAEPNALTVFWGDLSTDFDSFLIELIGPNSEILGSQTINDSSLREFRFTGVDGNDQAVRVTGFLSGSPVLVKEVRTNYIINGGFEKDIVSEWSYWNGFVTTNGKIGGQREAKIKPGAGAFQQTVALEPFTHYRFSCDSRFNDLTATVRLEISGHRDGEILTMPLKTTALSGNSLAFITGAAPTDVKVGVIKSSGDKIWLDNYRIQKTATNLGSDSDNDMINDQWEINNFGSLTVAQNNSNFDGNGLTDYEEFLYGLNPKNINDPKTLSLNSFGLDLRVVPNRTYQIYSSTDLINWTPYTAVQTYSDSTEEILNFQLEDTDSPQLFFSVVVEIE